MNRFQYMVNQIEPMIVREEKNCEKKHTKGTKHTKREFKKAVQRKEL
jgi:hypothetical protein